MKKRGERAARGAQLLAWVPRSTAVLLPPTSGMGSVPSLTPAAYHHGEASLSGTIVGLAQDFVGSNNINYLVPQGEWGWAALEGG